MKSNSITLEPGQKHSLHFGDCLEIMPSIPDGSVDAIICDLPFGTTGCAWDCVIPFAPMWKQLKRIVKPKGAIVLFGSQPFTSALIMSNLAMFKYEWIWRKNGGSNFATTKYQPMKEHENILVFCNGSPRYYPIQQNRIAYRRPGKQVSNSGKREAYGGFVDKGSIVTDATMRCPGSVQDFNRERGMHPTQKPLSLMKYLIQTYTQPEEIVLDFTMGSGTTGAAAIRTGRRFIGIEKDFEYFQMAQERIVNTIPGIAKS